MAYQSNDILAYCLLKSPILSDTHEELTKATITELKHDLIKDQLKKIFSDSSRHIPTKNEEVIKAEDKFLIEDFGQIAIEGFNRPRIQFRSTNCQQTYDQELDTY